MNPTTDYVALVGLDWGDKEHAFALRMTATDAIEEGKVEGSAEALHAWLDGLEQRAGTGKVAVAIESGRASLLHALVAHPRLEVYPINPATSARFRKAFTLSGAKDDGPDAQVLLTLVTQHRDALKRLELDSVQTRELAALVHARRAAVDQRTQLSNQLCGVLKSYFPQALLLVGDELASPLALDFLARWPDLAAAQTARPQTLRAFYTQHNVRRPERIAERLALLAKARPLTSDPAVVEPARLQVKMLVALLRVQQTHIAVFTDRIAERFAAHPQAPLFRQLPGAGPVLAPRLLVAFGDRRERYPTAASMQKYSGVAPVREKSGGQVWIHWRWQAPKFLRQTFIEWAGQTVTYCKWANAYYHQQRRRGKDHHAVLRALAFKWQRILWRCWHDGVPYDEARYLRSLEKRRSPLAALLNAA
jgi:transposase